MKIEELQSVNMMRTNPAHFGTAPVQNVFGGNSGIAPVSPVHSQNFAQTEVSKTSKSFETYLMEAVNSVNQNQLEVNKIQERLITDPDSVDIHDVTIAMSKARMSMNLAQTVIDRLVTSWNEISTTR